MSRPLVIDPSAILALGLLDEVADYADGVADRIRESGAAVPAIFWFEIRNVLVVNERRGRLAPEDTAAFLATLGEMPIEIQPPPTDLAVLELARSHDLSVYDAAYLELAYRTKASLATLDQALSSAAETAGVPVFSA